MALDLLLVTRDRKTVELDLVETIWWLGRVSPRWPSGHACGAPTRASGPMDVPECSASGGGGHGRAPGALAKAPVLVGARPQVSGAALPRTGVLDGFSMAWRDGRHRLACPSSS